MEVWDRGHVHLLQRKLVVEQILKELNHLKNVFFCGGGFTFLSVVDKDNTVNRLNMSIGLLVIDR